MIEADSKQFGTCLFCAIFVPILHHHVFQLPRTDDFQLSHLMISFLILAPFINNVYFCILKQNCK